MIVLARPYDDEEIVEVYTVNHAVKTKIQPSTFHLDWQKAKATVKSNPGYGITDIITHLEAKGWKITLEDTTTVNY